MKRPAFQFYPSDWRGDMSLQSCSIAARGLWHELLCVMHECSPYGHLAVNGKAMPEANAARAAGVTIAEYRRALTELEVAGVFSMTADGVIYSRRMVKDEQLRNVRAVCGRRGGNPILLNQTDKHAVKQMPTPSSSSSSSSSSSENLKPLSDSPSAASDVVPLTIDKGKPPRLTAEAEEVLDFLNAKTARFYRRKPKTLQPIIARLKDGYSVRECKAVIARKVREWGRDDKMAAFLRPATLFGAEKFAQYVGEVPPAEVEHA